MNDDTLIDEVRSAKQWVHGHTNGFERLAAYLAEIEKTYRDRTDAFAKLPRERTAEVIRAIEAAHDEPGHKLLNDTRPSRTA